MMKKILNDFCRPWNRFLPSEVDKSKLIIPVPESNCNTIEAVTIGPIPKEIILPKDAPKIIDKNSKFAKALFAKPNKGICPRI